MKQLSPDSRRIGLWRALRRKIRASTGMERHKLLRGYGDEICFIVSMAVKMSSNDWDMDKSMEFADILGVISGGLIVVDPYNPEWPGRDRLVVGGNESMLAVCSAFSTMGYFLPEQVPVLADAALTGETVEIPGLDLPSPGIDMPQHVWDLGIEARERKMLWRGGHRPSSGRDWADPAWNSSPALWRTFAIVKAGSDEEKTIRNLPEGAGGDPAGLTVVIATPNREAALLASVWRDAGWEAEAVGSGDRLRLYEALWEGKPERPQAIMLGMDATSTTGRRNMDLPLIGEMSDEQFNDLMGEFFHI